MRSLHKGIKQAMEQLQVSENRRFLVTKDNKPFFWLADTAWELFHRLTLGDAEYYLENRRRKGFNVIQAVILAEIDGLHTPNAYGEIPLHNDDPDCPNEAYFEHVDTIIRLAERKGLYIGLLPTWGDKIRPAHAVNSSVIFNNDNAYSYGRYLGQRYQTYTNIIWILGGDRDLQGLETFWRSMAAGIDEGQGKHTLTTCHPQGGASSSTYLHQEKWMDFNLLQSGHHTTDSPTWDMVANDYALAPTKPVIDGEPNYEDHPINWNVANGYLTAYDVRKQAYRALFAGAAGHTYGHQSIWQMYQPGRDPIAWPLYSWRDALDRPGAFQMQYVRDLMLSRPFLARIPDQELILSEKRSKGQHIQATRCSNGSYAFIYVPIAEESVTVDTGKLSGKTIQAWWYNPRTGTSSKIGLFTRESLQTFTTPVEGPDWVLVLDDAEQDFAPPGS